MNELDYFAALRSAINLRNKSVLEIGGAIPPMLVKPSGAKSWTAIDISKRRLAKSSEEAKGNSQYKAVLMDAAEMSFSDESFDVIYSVNCFEHIADLDSALRHIYRVLKKGGKVFAVFSPIWSGPWGHHTWVYDGDRPLTVADHIFPSWFHLILNDTGMRAFLDGSYKAETLDAIIEYIYNGSDISRRFDIDYEREISKYNYYPIFRFRIKSREYPSKSMLEVLREKCPEVRNFRTLGYVWILSKGRPAISAYLRAYFGLAAFILHKQSVDTRRILAFPKFHLH